MAAAGAISFSPSGSFLAVSSADGRLSVWESTSASIFQQYTPSSHLSATCTCLSWCPTRTEPPPKKKRRSHKVERRSSDASATASSQADVVAMGTQAGTILLYSLAKGDIHRHMDEGHTDRINDLCWHPDGETLFSCSEDQHIAEWDVKNSQVKCKWKADSSSVHSICLCPAARALLSAGRKIQLWDLDTKKVLKKFTGHASPVTRLKMVPSNTVSSDAVNSLESVEGLYFVSCAENDRVVNVWQVRTTLKSKSSIASLVVPDEPLDIDVLNTTKDQKTYLSVITRGGEVYIFDPVLNGKAKNQLQARSHLVVSTEGRDGGLPRPIPIMAAILCPEPLPPILIAHGTTFKLTFERVPFLSEDKDICLIREDPSSRTIPQASVEKLKKPLVTGNETVRTPGTSTKGGFRAAVEEEGATEERLSKRKASQSTVTIKDRLVALSHEGAQVDMSTRDQTARTGSLAMLLTQGLQSQDKAMLDSVFQQQKESVVRRTIQKLPIPLVVSLVQELASRMNTSPQSGLVLAQWTKDVLRERASYLMTCPELVSQLSKVYEMINFRTHQASRMTRLHGKLDLMLAQIASQRQQEEEQDRPIKAMLVYEEDSSDEGEIIEEPYPMHSESEGEWEELSEMDVQETEAGAQDAEEQGSDSDMSEPEEEDVSDDEAEEDEKVEEEEEEEEIGEPSSSDND